MRKRSSDPRSLEERVAAKDKFCVGCERYLLKSEFRTEPRNRDGLHSYCNECGATRSNRYNQKRIRDSWAERLMVYVRTAYASKRRAKVRSWEPTDLDVEFLWTLLKQQEGRCHWTGVEMSLQMGDLSSVSLDRLNCDQGYRRDNVVLCCKGANLARSDSSPEEMRAFVELIRRS